MRQILKNSINHSSSKKICIKKKVTFSPSVPSPGASYSQSPMQPMYQIHSPHASGGGGVDIVSPIYRIAKRNIRPPKSPGKSLSSLQNPNHSYFHHQQQLQLQQHHSILYHPTQMMMCEAREDVHGRLYNVLQDQDEIEDNENEENIGNNLMMNFASVASPAFSPFSDVESRIINTLSHHNGTSTGSSSTTSSSGGGYFMSNF